MKIQKNMRRLFNSFPGTPGKIKKNSLAMISLMLIAMVFVACKKNSSVNPQDANTNTDTSANYTNVTNTGATYLSESREQPAAAAAGNKILFAGGYGGTGLSKTVDIYDVEYQYMGNSAIK